MALLASGPRASRPEESPEENEHEETIAYFRNGRVDMTRILHLTLHREFFRQIAAREKQTEYREDKPYWRKRLEGRNYDVVKFRNGYARNAPEMLVECRGIRRDGKRRNANYAIRLGRILKLSRWKG